MDYQTIAKELLSIRAYLVQNPVHRMMDEFVHGEYCVLNYLMNHSESIYPKDLSKEMSVSTARVAALLKQMEKKGWITRNADVIDNRQTIISLTDEGKIEINSKREEIIDAVVNMLKEIGSEDAKELLRIQHKMIKK